MVKITTSFTEDEVRESILKLLYDRWKRPKGMSSANLKISDIRSALKSQGMDFQRVIRNLQYLVKTRWVEEIVKVSPFDTGKRVVHTESKSYTITGRGIDLFEGESKFQKKDLMTGIRIENVSGVVTIGDKNFIRTESIQLFNSLEELENRIRLTDQLTDEDKVNYTAEVKTIQSQLSKPNPDKNIVGRAWGALKNLATIGSLASTINLVGITIQKVTGG